MTEDQSTIIDEQANTACHYCGEIKELQFEGVCPECIKQTLLKYLPKLKQVLEDRYGEMLDRWLSVGHFNDVQWMIEDKFKINALLVKSLLTEVIQNAVEMEEIMLSLAGEEFWKPLEIEELMEHVYQSCVEDLQQLIRESIVKALRSAPTFQTERELMEIASGKRRCKRYLREEAISSMIYTRAFELPWPVEELVNLRYKQDKGKSLYTEEVEGRIHRVWKKIEMLLPEEMVKLIDKDDPL